MIKKVIDKEAYRNLIKDRYEPSEFVEMVGITIDEILDAFEDKWLMDEDLYDDTFGDYEFDPEEEYEHDEGDPWGE